MPFDPSSLLDFSHLATFLGGTAVGAAGTYMADRFTDQRRRGEAEATEHQRFSDLKSQMPELFAEIRKDLAAHPELAIRELVLLPIEGVIFNHDRPRFEYFESRYAGLSNWVSLLVEARFVEVVRQTGTPIYRLSEHFVARLRRDA